MCVGFVMSNFACVCVFHSHRNQVRKPLFVPNYARLDMDTLGNNLEDKLKDFLTEVRTHVNDAIDSLCEYTHTNDVLPTQIAVVRKR